MIGCCCQCHLFPSLSITVRQGLSLWPPFFLPPVPGPRAGPPEVHSGDTEVQTDFSPPPSPGIAAPAARAAAAGQAAFPAARRRALQLGRSSSLAVWAWQQQPLQMKGPFASKWHKLLFLYCSPNRGCPKMGVEASRFAASPDFQALLSSHSSESSLHCSLPEWAPAQRMGWGWRVLISPEKQPWQEAIGRELRWGGEGG